MLLCRRSCGRVQISWYGSSRRFGDIFQQRFFEDRCIASFAQVMIEELRLPVERYFPCRERLAVDPEAERVERIEHAPPVPQQPHRFVEISAVVVHVPEAGEPFHLLDRCVAEKIIAQDVVGGDVAVDHPVLYVVAREGRAGEFFEYPDLDLAVGEGNEFVQIGSEPLQTLAGEPHNEVEVHVCMGLVFQKSKIFEDFLEFQRAVDPRRDHRIEGLDSDLELQGTRRELGDFGTQRFGEMVGDHLEMGEIGGFLGKEEIEDRVGEAHVEVEGTVDEFETPHPPLPQDFEFAQDGVEGKIAHLLVDRGETEFAFEGASTGGLDVDVAVGYVLVAVGTIGEDNAFEIGERGSNNAL